MISKSNLSWFIPLVLIISFPLWKIPAANFLAPRGGINESMTKEQKKISQSFSMENVVIRQFKNNKLTAVVHAKTAATGKKPELLEFTQLDGLLYDAKSNQTQVLAKKGTYNSKTELLILKNNVVVDRKNDKQKLFTQHLNYNTSNKTLHSPTTTLIETPEAEIEGGSFTYNLKNKNYEFDKRVNMTLQSSISEKDTLQNNRSSAKQ